MCPDRPPPSPSAPVSASSSRQARRLLVPPRGLPRMPANVNVCSPSGARSSPCLLASGFSSVAGGGGGAAAEPAGCDPQTRGLLRTGRWFPASCCSRPGLGLAQGSRNPGCKFAEWMGPGLQGVRRHQGEPPLETHAKPCQNRTRKNTKRFRIQNSRFYRRHKAEKQSFKRTESRGLTRAPGLPALAPLGEAGALPADLRAETAEAVTASLWPFLHVAECGFLWS